jgi:hypothetical protein
MASTSQKRAQRYMCSALANGVAATIHSATGITVTSIHRA